MISKTHQYREREEVLLLAETVTSAGLERRVAVYVRSREDLAHEASSSANAADEAAADELDVSAGEGERPEPRVIGVHWLVAIDWPSGGRTYRNAQRRASFRAEATRFSSRDRARAERRSMRPRCRGGRVRVVRVVSTTSRP
jgi:hypothetical protein